MKKKRNYKANEVTFINATPMKRDLTVHEKDLRVVFLLLDMIVQGRYVAAASKMRKHLSTREMRSVR